MSRIYAWRVLNSSVDLSTASILERPSELNWVSIGFNGFPSESDRALEDEMSFDAISCHQNNINRRRRCRGTKRTNHVTEGIHEFQLLLEAFSGIDDCRSVATEFVRNDSAKPLVLSVEEQL